MTFIKNILFFALLSLCCSYASASSKVEGQGHEGVVMRMIGHQLLTSIGDTTSRVMPVVSKDNRYKISFEREFGFMPDSLINIVKRVMAETELAKSYLVEVHQCDSSSIVHSFEYRFNYPTFLPCAARELPEDCYDVYLTILKLEDPLKEKETENEAEKIVVAQNNKSNGAYFWVLVLAFILGLIFAILKSKQKKQPSHFIQLGQFQFDKINMRLLFREEKLELSNKETDLLALLYDKVNETISREILLKNVWGDDGNYVGRTLDVFISKLRKKLELDPNIQIMNIRGVGYKLIVEDLIA